MTNTPTAPASAETAVNWDHIDANLTYPGMRTRAEVRDTIAELAALPLNDATLDRLTHEAAATWAHGHTAAMADDLGNQAKPTMTFLGFLAAINHDNPGRHGDRAHANRVITAATLLRDLYCDLWRNGHRAAQRDRAHGTTTPNPLTGR